MTPFDRLYHETAEARERFLSIPLVKEALSAGASRELYIAFLTEAYHHVKNTFPLLAFAAARTRDEAYQTALVEYMNEERGHDKWILDDIRAVGGDADAVERGKPRIPCQVMVGYAYYAIEWVSPYSLLGMVHVLEGLSVMLADQVASAVKLSLGTGSEAGFSYLRSHGSLDVEHTVFFRKLVDSFEDRETQDVIIETAQIMYRLYGGIFEDLGGRISSLANAA